MGEEGLVIVKIGGSVATHKSKPYSLNHEALRAIFSALRESGELVCLVCGGGSFGHVVATRHGLSSDSISKDPRGAGETRLAMFRLVTQVSELMLQEGLSPFVLSPQIAFSCGGWESMADAVRRLVRHGSVPVSFGDVIALEEGYRVVGGDEISYNLSRVLNVKRVVFLIDKPGVLRDPNDPATVIKNLSMSDLEEMIKLVPRSRDATGGMKTKLWYAGMIARNGVDVYLVSGFRRGEVLNAVKGRGVAGTIIRGVSVER